MYDLSDDSSTSSILSRLDSSVQKKFSDDDSDSATIVEIHKPTHLSDDGLNKIFGRQEALTRNRFKEDDFELKSILEKYSGTNVPSTSTSKQLSAPVELIELSSSDDEFPRFAQHLKKPSLFEPIVDIPEEPEKEVSDVELPKLSPAKRKKLDKEQVKADRAARQAKKREEAEKEKLMKEAFKTANKNLKPEECIKFMTVLLDNEIANDEYGGEILNSLRAAEIRYRLQPQIIPYTVVWSRQVQNPNVDGDQVTLVSEDTEADEMLLIMNCEEIVKAVHNNSLITYIESLQSMFANKKLHLVLYGLKNYFKYHKSKKQKELRSQINEQPQKNNKKQDKVYENIPKVSKKQLEDLLTEMQLMCGLCYRNADTPQDVGSVIVQFTKSIAQAPFKLEKQQKQQQAEWYVAGDNKDCVRVDKNGNGLKRLWQQQFTAFPLARLEHAEAITNVYSTPSALIKEYENCTKDVGENLIEDIPVRRAAGPFTTVRNIGPELSRKIYKYFSSTDGDVVIK